MTLAQGGLASAIMAIVERGGAPAPRPGKLTGKIAFDASGSGIRVASDPPAATLGCAEGSVGPQGIGASTSRPVASLHKRITKPGRYALTFHLNPTGEKMLSRLAAADRSCRERHPRGGTSPTIAFGVSLTYELGG